MAGIKHGGYEDIPSKTVNRHSYAERKAETSALPPGRRAVDVEQDRQTIMAVLR
jgi:hypothetical protein